MMAGVDMVHVPYRGNGPMLQALVRRDGGIAELVLLGAGDRGAIGRRRDRRRALDQSRQVGAPRQARSARPHVQVAEPRPQDSRTDEVAVVPAGANRGDVSQERGLHQVRWCRHAPLQSDPPLTGCTIDALLPGASPAGLLTEAAGLAKAQKNAAAMNLIAKAYEMAGDAAAAAAAAKDAAALKSEKDSLATRAPGDFLGTLRVINNSDYALRVQAWGVYVGTVYPGRTGVAPVVEGTNNCVPVSAVSVGGTASATNRACFDFRGQTFNWYIR